MKSYHFDYNRTYDPPAPVISVRLRSERSGISALLPAFVDSGADATIVRVAILEQINAPYEDTRNLIGVTGLRRSVRLSIQSQFKSEPRSFMALMPVILEGPLHICELRI